MSVVRGALGPLLERSIKEQLAYEHEVLEGKKERIPVSFGIDYKKMFMCRL